MSKLAIIDLTESQDLDRQAMKVLLGGFNYQQYGLCGTVPYNPCGGPGPIGVPGGSVNFSYNTSFFQQTSLSYVGPYGGSFSQNHTLSFAESFNYTANQGGYPMMPAPVFPS